MIEINNPIDELAAYMRSIDGNHTMGTGLLAQAIIEAGWTRLPLTEYPPGLTPGWDADWHLKRYKEFDEKLEERRKYCQDNDIRPKDDVEYLGLNWDKMYHYAWYTQQSAHDFARARRDARTRQLGKEYGKASRTIRALKDEIFLLRAQKGIERWQETFTELDRKHREEAELRKTFEKYYREERQTNAVLRAEIRDHINAQPRTWAEDRRVHTIEDLDQLPTETVLRDRKGKTWTRLYDRPTDPHPRHVWSRDGMALKSSAVALPALILWIPGDDVA